MCSLHGNGGAPTLGRSTLWRRLLAAILLAALLAGCTAAPVDAPAIAVPQPEPEPARAPDPPPPEPPPRITIAAVGDLLMHLPLVQAAESAGGYDFAPLFAPVADYIAGADLAIANLETTLAGNLRRYSGYPAFNTPAELARDARDAGFDVLTTANNHSLDSGRRGVHATLDRLDELGIAHTGTYRTAGEQAAGALEMEVGGLRMGILSYTYGTNGIPLPDPWLVNLLDPARVLADMDRLRPRVDLVILALHWGNEYQTEPSPEQIALADIFIAAGADIILGCHPHVLQRMELRPVALPGGGSRQAAVIFSMGNFVSNQSGLERETGAIFLIDAEAGRGVVGARYVPTWVHKHAAGGRPSYRVLAAADALAAADPLLSAADRARLAGALELANRRLPGSPGVEVAGAPDTVAAVP